MAFAQTSRSRLAYKVTSTFGTEATGTYQEIPYTSHTLNLSKERVQGNDIMSDRIPRVDRHGNRQTAGDIVVDLRADVYDEFLESALFNTWDTTPVASPDVLKVGTTPKWLSIEDYAEDIGQARRFDSMGVSSMSISIRPNQMVQATFSLVGSDMSLSTSGRTVTAPASNQPFDSYSGALQISDSGSPLATIATITGIDFTIDNSLSPTYVVGSPITPQMEYGRAQVEGTITSYFEDASLLNRFISEIETDISVSVNDPTGANEYTFRFPRVKVNAADLPADTSESRIITLPFVAIYDPTEDTNLIITRPETA